MIKQIEYGIIERGFAEGWVEPKPPDGAHRLAASPWSAPGRPGWPPPRSSTRSATRHRLRARRGPGRPDPLRRARRQAREVDHRPPRRAARGRRGSSSVYGVDVGVDIALDELRASHDAVVIAIGSRIERELDAPRPRARRASTSRWTTCTAQPLGRRAAASRRARSRAAGKRVVVIGGGDTGTDCVATAQREGASRVTQLDVYPPPAGKSTASSRMADFPKRRWSTYALDEGGERCSAFNATAFARRRARGRR